MFFLKQMKINMLYNGTETGLALTENSVEDEVKRLFDKDGLLYSSLERFREAYGNLVKEFDKSAKERGRGIRVVGVLELTTIKLLGRIPRR